MQPEAEVTDVEEGIDIIPLLGRQCALHNDPLKVRILSILYFSHPFRFQSHPSEKWRNQDPGILLR